MTVPTRWVATDNDLGAVVDAVLDHPEYAIDTEFLRERTYFPQLALVQIAWPGHIALIDPLAVDVRPLNRLLRSDRLGVLHACDQDLEVLYLACGTGPARIFDTQLAAGFVGFTTPSLSTLAERLLGLHLSKGDRLTDWTQRPLTPAQRRYAAADVAHLLEMKALLVEQLERSGRLGWAEDECELVLQRPRTNSVPERAWWKLKDGRVLRGADRLVAQELAAWREQKARDLDRPSRFIIPDLGIVTIAQSRPATTEALGSLRGLDGRFARGALAGEILDAVARGSALPASALLLPETDEFDRRLRPALTLVSAWVAQLAKDAKIDATLLATRSDLASFLRGDEHARLATGWREGLVGQAVRDLVDGHAALGFAANGSLVLERRSGVSLAPEVTLPDAPWVDEAVAASGETVDLSVD